MIGVGFQVVHTWDVVSMFQRAKKKNHGKGLWERDHHIIVHFLSLDLWC